MLLAKRMPRIRVAVARQEAIEASRERTGDGLMETSDMETPLVLRVLARGADGSAVKELATGMIEITFGKPSDVVDTILDLYGVDVESSVCVRARRSVGVTRGTRQTTNPIFAG